MDCNSALVKLELSQSEACAQDDPELVAAAAHLADCARCRTLVANREEMDRAISAVCRDVAIPAGLESRLLETVHAELAPKTIPLRDNQSPRRRPQRSIRRMAAIAAGLLCLVAGGWYWWVHDSTVSVDRITLAAGERLDSQTGGPLFVGHYEPAQHVPTASLNFPPSMRMDTYRELFPQQPELDIAISEFDFRNGGGRAVHGALIIAPAGVISPLPAATSMADATPIYRSRFSAVSWHDSKFVYVCLVYGGDAPLRELQRQVGEQTT